MVSAHYSNIFGGTGCVIFGDGLSHSAHSTAYRKYNIKNNRYIKSNNITTII